VKIYVAAVEALRNSERQDEYLKNRWFSAIHPTLNATFFLKVLLKLTMYDQESGSGAVFSFLMDNSIIHFYIMIMHDGYT
jgi:hypothetical protein